MEDVEKAFRPRKAEFLDGFEHAVNDYIVTSHRTRDVLVQCKSSP
jgi:hypothetical protein